MKGYLAPKNNKDRFGLNKDYSKFEFIFEINNKVNIYDIIKFKNKYYIINAIDHQANSFFCDIVEFNIEGEEHSFESHIICPYCGYVDQDSWEADDESDEKECGKCGLTFGYERIVTVEYNSYPITQNIKIKDLDII